MATPSRVENRSNKKSKDDSKGKAIQRPHKHVIVFLYSILFVVGAIAIGIGIAYWQNHTYRGNWFALGWGVAGGLVLLAGGAVLFYGSVIEPSRTEQSQPPADRPWLNVEVLPGGPIVYRQQQAEMAAFIPVTYGVTNRGRSPSSEIQLKATLFFARPGEDLKERQRRIVSSPEGHPFQPGVVFPATPEEFTITYVRPISEMQEAVNQGAPPREHFDAYIGGCINYTYGGTPTFQGETGFLYEIQVHDETNPATQIVPEIGKEIPLERLTFRRYFPGGSEWAK